MHTDMHTFMSFFLIFWSGFFLINLRSIISLTFCRIQETFMILSNPKMFYEKGWAMTTSSLLLWYKVVSKLCPSCTSALLRQVSPLHSGMYTSSVCCIGYWPAQLRVDMATCALLVHPWCSIKDSPGIKHRRLKGWCLVLDTVFVPLPHVLY